MTRREQILKAAEFDSSRINKIIEIRKTLEHEHLSLEELASNEFSVGSRVENSRLLPLITAMADEIEMLRGALEDLIAQAEQYVVPYGSIRLEFSKKALSAPTALDALLQPTATKERG